ncbi:MAG TPA: ATP-dependent helicase [Ignavibacteria bacterium]|jgi:DNA helicase-2/ATP-dependent DNA helicase PcrA
MDFKKYIIKNKFEIVKKQKQYKINYEQELNSAQYEAVTYLNGPALIIAGAGTGKTRTIIYRVAYLIENEIEPSDILLLTFTRKAAREMLRRAAHLLEDGKCEKVSGGTFHSFATSILRKYANLIKYDNSFTIIDSSDSEDVINLLRSKMKYGEQKKRFPKKDTLRDIFSKSINTVQKIEYILEKDYPYYMDEYEKINNLFHQYTIYKKRYNLMDYDDLLLNLLFLLKENPKTKLNIQNKYKYIMIDEYQDTNKLQAEIVKLLGDKNENVFAVGDDSQSIYSFRGANFKNILEFPSIFKNTKIIKLEQNYRSTQEILNLTNEIINNAIEKYSKRLYTNRSGVEKPWIVVAESEEYQSKFIAHKILRLREEGIDLKDIAVLFRSSFHSFDLEIELSKSNIPFIKFGGFKFIETAHIKDIISYLRILTNPKDIVSWNRVILLIDGVGPRTAEKIIQDIEMNKIGIDKPHTFEKYGKHGTKIFELLMVLNKIYSDKVDLSTKLNILLEYYDPLFKSKYDDFSKRKKDIDIFLTIAERYKNVDDLLVDILLEPPNESVIDIDAEDKNREYVTLSTIHSAKGLEWKVVFVISALDGRFPSSKAIDNSEELEEERRLMYVACTRAKDYLFITYPTNIFDRDNGIILMKPSRFISDIDKNLVENFNIVIE